MKKLLFIPLVAVFAVSCSQSTDKKSESKKDRAAELQSQVQQKDLIVESLAGKGIKLDGKSILNSEETTTPTADMNFKECSQVKNQLTSYVNISANLIAAATTGELAVENKTELSKSMENAIVLNETIDCKTEDQKRKEGIAASEKRVIELEKKLAIDSDLIFVAQSGGTFDMVRRSISESRSEVSILEGLKTFVIELIKVNDNYETPEVSEKIKVAKLNKIILESGIQNRKFHETYPVLSNDFGFDPVGNYIKIRTQQDRLPGIKTFFKENLDTLLAANEINHDGDDILAGLNEVEGLFASTLEAIKAAVGEETMATFEQAYQDSLKPQTEQEEAPAEAATEESTNA